MKILLFIVWCIACYIYARNAVYFERRENIMLIVAFIISIVVIGYM